MIDLHKAGKDWYEISSLLRGGGHAALDCRSYWFENYRDTFHELMDDGELNTDKLARQGWKAGAEMEEEEEKEEEEYDDEADAEGDIDDEYIDS